MTSIEAVYVTLQVGRRAILANTATSAEADVAAAEIILVQNWLTELERLVPTD